MYGSLSVLQHGKNQSDNKTKTVKLNRFKSCKNNRKKTGHRLQKICFSFLQKTVELPKVQQIAFTAFFFFLKNQGPKELVIKPMRGQQGREQAKVAPVRLLIVLMDFMISSNAAGPV